MNTNIITKYYVKTKQQRYRYETIPPIDLRECLNKFVNHDDHIIPKFVS